MTQPVTVTVGAINGYNIQIIGDTNLSIYHGRGKTQGIAIIGEPGTEGKIKFHSKDLNDSAIVSV